MPDKNVIELSIEETNKLRTELGLAPLRISTTKSKKEDFSKKEDCNKEDVSKKKDDDENAVVLELSVDASNELRAKLGLKPLSMMQKNEPEHKPAQNEGEIQELRERIEREKLKRQVQKGITSTFGTETLSGETTTNDAFTWAQKMKQQQQQTGDDKEKKKKKKTRKLLGRNYDEEDLQGMNVGHTVSEFEIGSTTILTLADTSLLHDNENDDEAQPQLENVNLADQRIQNDRLRQKRQQEMGLGRAGGYAGYDDDEFEELGGVSGPSRGVRGTTNDDDDDDKKQQRGGFKIGGASKEETEQTTTDLFAFQRKNAISLVEQSNTTTTTTTEKYNAVSDYLTHEEDTKKKKKKKDAKFKKKKNKKEKKKHNRKMKVEEDDSNTNIVNVLEETAVVAVGTAKKRKRRNDDDDNDDDDDGNKNEHISNSTTTNNNDDDNNNTTTTTTTITERRRERFEQIMEKGNRLSTAAFQPKKTAVTKEFQAEDEEPDDEFLMEALAKARCLRKRRETTKKGAADEAVVNALLLAKPDVSMSDTDATTIKFAVDETREFTRALRARVDHQAERQKAKKVTKMDISTKKTEETTSSSIIKEDPDYSEETATTTDIRELSKEIKVEENEDAAVGGIDGTTNTTAPIGRGMAGILSMLRHTGEIGRNSNGKTGREEMRGRAKDERTYDDYAALDLQKVVRIDRTNANAKDIDFATRQIKLDYRDEHGRLLTRKEAYRNLCYQFHGHGSSNRNQEKRLRQIEREQAEARLACRVGAGSLGALKATQKATGKAFVVHKT